MNQLSPLVKMHGGGFNPDLMSPGLTPLLGRNNLTDSLTMPIPTLMSAENFGIMSPTGTPGRGYGYYRLNSIRKIEFNEGDEAIDALVARYQEPPSLTVPESASGDERPVGRRVSFDLSEHANARGVRDTAGAEDIGLPSLVRPPTLPLINKRSHVEFAVDVAAAPPSGPVPPAEEEPARAILVKTEKTAAPAKPARRKAPMSSRTRAGKSDGDGITSPAPQTTTRAYSTPSNRNTQPLGETTPSQAVPIKKITPCNCKKSKCLKL